MTTAVLAPARYPWRAIFACAGIWAAASFLNALFGYAIPGIIAEYGLSVAEVGLILSASFLFSAAMAVAAGVFAERIGPRRMMLGLLTGAALLTGGIAILPGIAAIAVLRATGTGVGSALGPLTGGHVSNLLPAQRRPLGIAIVQCGFPFGWCIAAILAAPIIDSWGWRAIFLTALPVAAAAPLLLRALPNITSSPRKWGPSFDDGVSAASPELGPRFRGDDEAFVPAAPAMTLRQLYRGPVGRRAKLVALGFFSYAAAYAGSAFYMPAYLQQVRGYAPADAAMLVGLTYGVGSLGYIGAAIVGQTLLDRRGTAMLWCLLGCLAFLGFVWLPQTPWQDFALFSATAFFFYGCGSVMFAVASEVFPPAFRTAGIALSASLGVNCGFAVSPTLSGLVVEALGWRMAFSLFTVPLLAVAFACFALLGQGFSHVEEEEYAQA